MPGIGDERIAHLVALAQLALRQKLELGEGDFGVDAELLEQMAVRRQPRFKDLDQFNRAICNCTKCPLHKGRNKFVFGVGNPHAAVIFIGEGPGAEEDRLGEPFVGRAGQLLDKILASIKFTRRDVYIANVVKCRPPENREPEAAEMEACLPYLLEQIRMIDPKIVCCLGRVSAQALLKTKLPMSKLRGYFHEWEGRKLLVTYHPAALLRFPDYKRDTWEDMKMLRAEHDRLTSR